jgi:hypothetical protein
MRADVLGIFDANNATKALYGYTLWDDLRMRNQRARVEPQEQCRPRHIYNAIVVASHNHNNS